MKQAGLVALNALPPAELRTELKRICGSTKWVDAVAPTFPHASPASVLTAMDTAWWSLSQPDYLEAFAAHPRIGDAAALKKVRMACRRSGTAHCGEGGREIRMHPWA